MIKNSTGRRWGWIAVFGIAFGYLEASVVVYLRELYYPSGFHFPAALPETRLLFVEVARELATLTMILGVAMVGGTRPWSRFGVFCVVFGIWDLVYYLGLWVVLGWPESLLTWDILFLIPLVWAGPVLSAVLVAASLVAAGSLMLFRVESGLIPVQRWWIWGGAVFSLLLLLGSFMANHSAINAGQAPERFPWILYGAGMILGWFVFIRSFFPGLLQKSDITREVNHGC